MNNIDKFIKEMSLIFTNTLNRDDFFTVGFNSANEKTNYDNSISFYDLISSFNNLYHKFKEEYDNLKELNIAQDIEVIDFYKKNNFKLLSLFLNKPTICKYDKTILFLRSDNGNFTAYRTCNRLDKSNYNNYINYSEYIDIDKSYRKKLFDFLELFEKYENLFYTYNFLKNKFVFGDATNVLSTSITGDFLKKLECFKLVFGQIYFLPNIACANVYLNEYLNIDNSNFEMELEGKEYILSNDEANKILKKVYINKKYLGGKI